MPTLAEVDEALNHLRAVPADQRGAGWHSYCDALLAQRNELLRPKPAIAYNQRETRVVFSGETR